MTSMLSIMPSGTERVKGLITGKNRIVLSHVGGEFVCCLFIESYLLASLRCSVHGDAVVGLGVLVA